MGVETTRKNLTQYSRRYLYEHYFKDRVFDDPNKQIADSMERPRMLFICDHICATDELNEREKEVIADWKDNIGKK